MRSFKTLITCAAIVAVAAVPVTAQSSSTPKPNAMQSDKSSMTAPDSGDKHKMSKKDGMKDTAMAKPAMKSGMSDKAMMKDKSKDMMKPKSAKDSAMMKHDGMAKDSSMSMPKKPKP